MLYLIKDLSDKLLNFISEDPVRPSIPKTERVGDNKDIFVHRNEDDTIDAITCVSYLDHVPVKESDLFTHSEYPNTAIFYTIWSYKPGAGRQLIMDSVQYIQDNKSEITRFVTLSPKTEMARRFHLKNGAIVFRENDETVNYEYIK